jgi:PAS domain S-box-containing protein
MKRIIRAGFFRKILLPAMLAILLFVISLFAYVVPTFERNAMEQKKNMLRELTNIAWSILDKYNRDFEEGIMQLDEARAAAIEEIEALRYGPEEKDYFWITDLAPRMIMHPYVHELMGQSLSNFADPDGVRLFREAVDIAKREGEGYINYQWQLRDDTTQIAPKLSFVKLFTPWKWVVSTGIYIDDVHKELSALRNRLLLILLGITIIIALIIFFITYQSLGIENRRRAVEGMLKESREKYRSLLESSTEGIILLLNSQIAYTNSFVQKWLKYSGIELQSMSVSDIIPSLNIDEIMGVAGETRFETTVAGKDGSRSEALLTVLPVQFADKMGVLLTFRDISEHRLLVTEVEELRSQLREMADYSPGDINRFAAYASNVAALHNQTVSDIAMPFDTCNADAPVKVVVDILNRNGHFPVLVLVNNKPAGIITSADILKRVTAEGLSMDLPVASIMSAPLISVGQETTLASAASIIDRKGISHLMVRNQEGDVTGIVTPEIISRRLFDSAAIIDACIDNSSSIDHLSRCRMKLPVMIKPLLSEIGNVSTFTRILSHFNDVITTGIIEMAIRELGPPPSKFSFVVFGSAGREELTFNSDQDNAIIYTESDLLTPEETKEYFMKLGTRICNSLHETGLVRCKGGYMASNPKWCTGIEEWKVYFNDWIMNSDADSLLNFSVFFDFRHLYGELSVFTGLENFVFDSLKRRTTFFFSLAQSITRIKYPSISTAVSNDEEGKKKEQYFDVKAAMAPLVMIARIYALHKGIRLKGTSDRIRALKVSGALSEETCDELSYYHNFLMYHRMQTLLGQAIGREEFTNNVPLSSMNETEQMILKKIISRAGGFNEILTAEFMSAFQG